VRECRLTAILIFSLTALLEISGCFAFWMWARQGQSALWLAPGVLALFAFAWLLTKVDVEHAGRVYAVYGGIYIVASLGWLWAVEGARPDRWDILGSIVCLTGAAIILWAPRGG
jgi:small multidrug resistance family-3 protein